MGIHSSSWKQKFRGSFKDQLVCKHTLDFTASSNPYQASGTAEDGGGAVLRCGFDHRAPSMRAAVHIPREEKFSRGASSGGPILLVFRGFLL